MKQVPGVKEVAAPIYNAKTPDQASVSIINAYSKYAPQDARTDDIVSALRDRTIPQRARRLLGKAYVSGANAAFTDIGNIIFSRAPYFLLYIIGVTFVVLAMAFRSVVIATKAALTTLMSALVGFGVLTLVVQLGHGMGLIGLDRTGPIESFVPPIAFAILFGLSMDYEVFLMSRIREEHIHGEDTVSAVKDGMAGVGRVILAAALIMSSVFFSFLLTPDRVSKEFGLLLGVAILTDAIIIRLTLVPALLTLLGERSWAMPAWLDKALPNLTIEPPGERRAAARRRRRSEPAAGDRLAAGPQERAPATDHRGAWVRMRPAASLRRMRCRSIPSTRSSLATRGSEPAVPRHAYPTSRPPMHTSSVESEPTPPSPGPAAARASTPPKFSHRLDEALHREGRMADLAGGLTRHQVDRMLAGLPPGGFGGDFAHMSPEHLKALAQLMRGDGGPLGARAGEALHVRSLAAGRRNAAAGLTAALVGDPLGHPPVDHGTDQ